ncbi:MAG TPA: hypothetical protein VNQ53_05880 [Nocardioides sp.]|nr:hypothetical protein [Nocardioides sp.]
MSDERDLTPEQEARVARLLADARVVEPMPPEVAARLDRVLEGMSGERVLGPGEVHPPVVNLAARRRRRVVTLLAAAAAVVVAGVGVGQLFDSQDDSDGGSTAVQAEDQGDAASEDEANPLPSDGAPQLTEPPPLTEGQVRALGAPARITAGAFADDVRRLQDRPGVRTDGSSGAMRDRDLAAPEMDFSCGAADYGVGKLMAVRYNGMPAVLAYRPPKGDTQVVDLLQCGSGDLVRSTTIPLP